RALPRGRHGETAKRAGAVAEDNGAARGPPRRYAAEALRLARTHSDAREVTVALHSLAVVAGKEGHYDLARSFLDESLETGREFGDEFRTGTVILMGLVAYQRG